MKSPFNRRVPEGLRATLQSVLPPLVLDTIKRTFGSVHYHGDFSTWERASAASQGFDSKVILDRVTAASLSVKNGEAAYERDSVTFQEKAYVWPVLAGLLWAACRSRGVLSVLDFGGSLGSSYYQHRSWLSKLERLRWSIVEQPKFAEVGKRYFEDETLQFFTDIQSAKLAEQPNVLLISAVLQYLEKPYEVIEELVACEFDVILLDRTAFSAEDRDRLTVQRVGERIYPASYPAWFFARDRFLEAFESRYRVVQSFRTKDRANVPSYYEGFLLERRD